MASELAALAWLLQQTHGSVDGLPLDLWSPRARELLSQKPIAIQEAPATPGEAAAYLRALGMGYVAKAAGKGQRAPHRGDFEKGLETYQYLLSILDPPQVEHFNDVELQMRVFVPTGVASIDEEIQGLAQGELGIIALPSGRGKSLILVTTASSAAEAGEIVLYITVADQGRDELIPRMDTCILGTPEPIKASLAQLKARHEQARRQLKGQLWFADYTDRECRLSDIERSIQRTKPTLVIVDHADDVISEYSHDPTVTRHSLRVIYSSLKRLSVKHHVPIWTASQTHDESWRHDYAGISNLAEAKTGKASGAAILLVFTGGYSPMEGIMTCHIGKARRRVRRRSFDVSYDYGLCRAW